MRRAGFAAGNRRRWRKMAIVTTIPSALTTSPYS